jgi:hypothetical protein
MRRLLQGVCLVAVAGSILIGCSSPGEISEADIKRNAKAQADWIHAHPPPADTRVEQ